MSKYSGRCDVYDTFIEIHKLTDEDVKNNLKLYKGYRINSPQSQEPLKLESVKDLVPYYGHIIGSMAVSGNKISAYIPDEPSYMRERTELLNIYLESILKVYRSCKRRKVPFTEEEVFKKITKNWHTKEKVELIQLVKEFGNKTTIDKVNIDLDYGSYYRNELFKVMEENGFNPKDFGYI